MREIIHGECIEEMKKLKAGSIDMVLTDLPYGITGYSWDSTILKFEDLWKEWDRVLKPNGCVLLFASGKFVGQAMTSSKHYKYMWTWIKSCPTNFVNAKKMPMRKTEQILVFYKKCPTYNPQGVRPTDRTHYKQTAEETIEIASHGKQKKSKRIETKKTSDYAGRHSDSMAGYALCGGLLDENGKQKESEQFLTGYPNDILYYNSSIAKRSWDKFHPSQKPVELLRYLIRTYTNEGETVLDCTAGSMSTACAAIMENREYVMIDLDEDYVRLGKERVDKYIKRKKAELF